MSENKTNSDAQFETIDEPAIPSELESLKVTATKIGVSFSPNIGVDKLRDRVNAKLNPDAEESATEPDETTSESTPAEEKSAKVSVKKPVRTEAKVPKKSLKQLKQERIIADRKRAHKLIRIVAVNMNPNKSGHPGEIFTVANAVVGTIKKYVPFGVEAGYHVPNIIYEMMREREYQSFTKKKMPNGRTKVEAKLVKEFNIQVLDPLTLDEMKHLREQQALNHSID